MMPQAYRYYDHVEHRYKQGFVLVTLGYADHKTSYPVDVEDYVPEDLDPGRFRTKIEIAKMLIQRDHGLVRFRFVVFDSRYLCDEMHRFVRGMGKHWISGLKSDRLVLHRGRYVSLAEYAELVKTKAKAVADKLVYATDAKLHSIKDRVKPMVVYEDKEAIFLACSLASMKAEGVLRHYAMRFLLEVFHRDAKQHLGLGGMEGQNTRRSQETLAPTNAGQSRC